MALNNAGGTSGGAGQFVAGAGLILGGLYLLLRNIWVSSGFSWSMGIIPMPFGGGGSAIPAGFFVIGALIGFCLLFYDAKKIWGWLLLVGSVGAIVASVIMSLHFALRPMSMLELLLILGVLGAGIGLFLRSLRPQ